jgi:hypothetical protein
MISRRQFLSFASVPFALSAELAVPKPLRTIFLPPAAGWVAPYARIPVPELYTGVSDILRYDLAVEEVYAAEIASGAIRYDAAAGMLELWKEPDPLIVEYERQASIERHRTGREIYGVARDTRAAEDDAADAAKVMAAREAGRLERQRMWEKPWYRGAPDALCIGDDYRAETLDEAKRVELWRSELIDYARLHPDDEQAVHIAEQAAKTRIIRLINHWKPSPP